MRRFFIGAGAAALIAIPAWAIVADGHAGHHDTKGPQTRAEVEAKVKEHFTQVDANKDGVITKEEARAFHARHRAEMRDKMFAMLDTDKSGQISREEFSARPNDKDGHERDMHGMRGHRMMRGGMFAKADGNGDGKITLSEATGKALEMFDRADANKDGTVTPEERRAAWKSRTEQSRDKAS